MNLREIEASFHLLGALLNSELFVHGKAAQERASTLNAFLGVELETVAVKERPGGKTSVRGNSRNTACPQDGFDVPVETGGDTAAGEGGMSIEKIEVAVVIVGNEAGANAVSLNQNRVEMAKPFLPLRQIGLCWRPGRNLLGRVIGRGQRANRGGVSLNDSRQVG